MIISIFFAAIVLEPYMKPVFAEPQAIILLEKNYVSEYAARLDFVPTRCGPWHSAFVMM